MPRRDVVLTGLIAFGAGVAVGANWGKLRKKIGPILEKLGLQMADLGDFLSASDLEEFAPEMMKAEANGSRPRARRRGKAKAVQADAAFVHPQTRRRQPRHAAERLRQITQKRKSGTKTDGIHRVNRLGMQPDYGFDVETTMLGNPL